VKTEQLFFLRGIASGVQAVVIPLARYIVGGVPSPSFECTNTKGKSMCVLGKFYSVRLLSFSVMPSGSSCA
jgi:hypothetical protein